VVNSDFEMMAECGFNAVRTYTCPPPWLLDMAARRGLRVMVGLPWEQHVTFLDDRRRARRIRRQIVDDVRACDEHPAILCYAIGNEIPAPIVRWHGRKKIESFLRAVYEESKGADPETLFTYVNYPTTEYLELEFLDLACFNVFLESPERLKSYMAKLQNIAGDRPLIMSEIGLDSRRNGLEQQAESIDWQVRRVFEAGSAGAFVFSWTDEWYRGGYDVLDWDFGLTTRDRTPKPALQAVASAYAAVPVEEGASRPRITVAICAYNAEATLRGCLEGCARIDYPNHEVVVVDDGSRDGTAEVAAEFDVRLIRQENQGLSAARNTALHAATGEIIAYLDSDAYPDPHWLTYLATAFADSDHVGIGGPNIVPPDAKPIEECVANAPGGPIHVLVSDTKAEHIPGCNMAFRKEALLAIGGFDEQFRIAGDDVDVCWRLQAQGWTLGFSAPAMVWHHRRDSVKGYWKQQLNYGRAEAMLERKWPEKYNRFGHPKWSGRIYGRGSGAVKAARWHVYHGVWGTSAYQSLYEPAPGTLRALPLMPEWYLAVLLLLVLAVLSLSWPPLMVVVPLLGAAVGAPFIEAVYSALTAKYPSRPRTFKSNAKRRLLTTVLHLLQPLARLLGRLHYNLTPWRRRGIHGLLPPFPRLAKHWHEWDWRAPEGWLADLEQRLIGHRVVVVRGGEYDRWDLEAWCGILGGARLLLAVEEHGWGRQLVRVRVWPRLAPLSLWLAPLLIGLVSLALLGNAWVPLGALSLLLALMVGRSLYESAAAIKSVVHSVGEWKEEAEAAAEAGQVAGTGAAGETVGTADEGTTASADAGERDGDGAAAGGSFAGDGDGPAKGHLHLLERQDRPGQPVDERWAWVRRPPHRRRDGQDYTRS
jgi:GT2 family glycosyltransferase